MIAYADNFASFSCCSQGMMGALTTAQSLKIGWVGGKYDQSSYDVKEEVTVEVKEEYTEETKEVKEEIKVSIQVNANAK